MLILAWMTAAALAYYLKGVSSSPERQIALVCKWFVILFASLFLGWIGFQFLTLLPAP